MNTELRSKAKSKFEKNYYKQKNCSWFGKSMENKRGRLKVQPVGDALRNIKLTSKPNYSGVHNLGPDLQILTFTNEKVMLNSTIAIGAAVLDLSKLIMYKLAYEDLPKYERELGCKLEVLGGRHR